MPGKKVERRQRQFDADEQAAILCSIQAVQKTMEVVLGVKLKNVLHHLLFHHRDHNKRRNGQNIQIYDIKGKECHDVQSLYCVRTGVRYYQVVYLLSRCSKCHTRSKL